MQIRKRTFGKLTPRRLTQDDRESSLRYNLAFDDASRKILLGGEFDKTTAEHSIETFREAQLEALGYNVEIREVNTDRGTQFYSNKKEGTSL